MKAQGFSFSGIGGDLSAGLTKAIDSVTGGMANAVLAGVNPAVYEQLAETQFLVVLGAENVFVASKPGESTLQAYEKAQQIINAHGTQTQTALEVTS
jgi:carbohydrate-binding DOMON domain-containing protein